MARSEQKVGKMSQVRYFGSCAKNRVEVKVVPLVRPSSYGTFCANHTTIACYSSSRTVLSIRCVWPISVVTNECVRHHITIFSPVNKMFKTFYDSWICS
jgi:hypothetical protein